jgi:hypothetical protein
MHEKELTVHDVRVAIKAVFGVNIGLPCDILLPEFCIVINARADATVPWCSGHL